MRRIGPTIPFEVLLQNSHAEPDDSKLPLPPEFASAYGGQWLVPRDAGECYSYSNFVMSHDGRISFALVGHEGGGDVSDFNENDQWLMALLRARADAVLVGANTLRTEPEHLWTPDFIFSRDSEEFTLLRESEGRAPNPIQVFVTRNGAIPNEAAVFEEPDLQVIIATTTEGAKNLSTAMVDGSHLSVIVAGQREVDFHVLYQRLREEFNVKTVLCEGGPQLYGALLASGRVDEEFLTWSPVVIGSSSSHYRPGLIEALALSPRNSYRRQLVTLRRAEEHLFLQSRYVGLEPTRHS